MKSHAFSVTKMRPKRSALSSGPRPSLFHDGSSLLPFRTWEEQQQHNLPIFTRRLKTLQIHNCCETSWIITRKRRMRVEKLLNGSSKPASLNLRKAKVARTVSLPKS